MIVFYLSKMTLTAALKNAAKTEDEVLRQPERHITSTPRKDNRIFMERLLIAYNFWLKIPEDKFEKIKEIMLITENSILLLDDLRDETVGPNNAKPTAQAVYGMAHTINTANYLACLAISKTCDLDHPEAFPIFMQQSMEYLRGDNTDLCWSDKVKCPTEEEYKNMCIRRIGSLCLSAFRLMRLFSKNTSVADGTKLAEILGPFLQIKQDYLSLRSKDHTWSKNCIAETRFVFPVVHGIQIGDKKLIYLLRQRTKKIEAKQTLVKFLQENGSFAHTEKVLLQLQKEAENELKKYDENSYMSQFFSLEGVVGI